MSILSRYLFREVLTTTLGVTGVCVVLFLVNQSVHLLGRLANGQLLWSMVLHALWLQLPVLSGYLLPMGFFFSLFLVYGRLYADSELTVLHASGFSRKNLLWQTLKMASGVAVLVGGLVFYVSPHVFAMQQRVLSRNADSLALEHLKPNTYTPVHHAVIHVDGVDVKGGGLQGVSVMRINPPENTQPWMVLQMQRARHSSDGMAHDLLLENGTQFFGKPGHGESIQLQFASGHLYWKPDKPAVQLRPKAQSTQMLWQHRKEDSRAAAEWGFRVSMVVSVWVLAIIAVGLCRVSVRQGRFAHLVPAVLIYMVYANLLIAGRGWVASGRLSLWALSWIHLGFLAFAWVRQKRTEAS